MVCHGERVLNITTEAETVGCSASCPNEIVLWNKHVISTQGHPEFTTDFMLMIASHLKEKIILSDEELEKSRKTFDCVVNSNITFINSFLTHQQ